MTIETIDGLTAIKNIKENPFSRWYTRFDPNNRVEPLAKPGFKNGFDIFHGESIFTIGSCFARNIERYLMKSGFKIPAHDVFRKNEEFEKLGRNILNNYSVASIFNELSWALDDGALFEEDENFFEIYPEKFVDINLNHMIAPTSIDIVRQRRNAISEIYSEIRNCRVIIITLGLTEVWYDKISKRHINTVPRRMMVRREPERFDLHVLDYDETKKYALSVIDLIKQHCRSDVQVLLTVSPVPLTGTYRDMDVMTANMYSKSVLRTVTEEIVNYFDFVHYFPSFESIIYSERCEAILDDLIHPTEEVIELNCVRMIDSYTKFSSSELTSEEIKRDFRNSNDSKLLYGIIKNRLNLIHSDPELAFYYCKSCLQNSDIELAKNSLPYIDGFDDKNEVFLLKAMVALSDGNPKLALLELGAFPEAKKYQIRHLSILTKSYVELGDIEKAREAGGRWARHNTRIPEPFRLLGVACSMAGDVERADNYFRQALEKADDDPRLMLDFAEHLTRSGRDAEAKDFLKTIDPKNVSHQARIDALTMDI